MSFIQSADNACALLENLHLRVLVWEAVVRPADHARAAPSDRAWILPGIVSEPDVVEAAANMALNVAEDRSA